MTKLDTIILRPSMNFSALSIVFICVFAGFLMYMLIMASEDKNFQKKLKRAKRLIEDGHKSTMHGKKNDGIYQETKRERTAEEKEKWEKRLKRSVAQDIKDLS